MAGLFDELFDFNQNGEMSTFEKMVEFSTFTSITENVDNTEKKMKLEAAGLDITELELMNEKERRQALQEVGLELEDYDFD
jgi:hypothetical protein